MKLCAVSSLLIVGYNSIFPAPPELSGQRQRHTPDKVKVEQWSAPRESVSPLSARGTPETSSATTIPLLVPTTSSPARLATVIVSVPSVTVSQSTVSGGETQAAISPISSSYLPVSVSSSRLSLAPSMASSLQAPRHLVSHHPTSHKTQNQQQLSSHIISTHPLSAANSSQLLRPTPLGVGLRIPFAESIEPIDTNVDSMPYLPPGLSCDPADRNLRYIRTTGRLSIGHLWGPYPIQRRPARDKSTGSPLPPPQLNTTSTGSSRLQTGQVSLLLKVPSHTDSESEDFQWICLGEEHLWIQLICEAGLYDRPVRRTNVELIVDSRLIPYIYLSMNA
ncbi:unnamed protein product [Protopolystoma xenopodis]|uniref:Uncharacterized protein n=1 Tax=Protopolystoma xenopodis TaxID=117903 RepID=A0A448XE35_9PLAT|nr:unnamed protein product [Protopolystoma xenopodis]